jgi:hypothetical protein
MKTELFELERKQRESAFAEDDEGCHAETKTLGAINEAETSSRHRLLHRLRDFAPSHDYSPLND